MDDVAPGGYTVDDPAYFCDEPAITTYKHDFNSLLLPFQSFPTSPTPQQTPPHILKFAFFFMVIWYGLSTITNNEPNDDPTLQSSTNIHISCICIELNIYLDLNMNEKLHFIFTQKTAKNTKYETFTNGGSGGNNIEPAQCLKDKMETTTYIDPIYSSLYRLDAIFTASKHYVLPSQSYIFWHLLHGQRYGAYGGEQWSYL